MKKIFLFSMFLTAAFLAGCDKDSVQEIKMNDIAYGVHPHQTMDILLPHNADVQHKAPVVFCIHGGSWSSGDKTDFDWMKQEINNANCAYVSINYRLLQDNVTYIQMLEDIDAAIAWLKTNSEIYNIKTDKMCMIGGSAGGHLALLYAYSKNSPIKIAFVSSMAGPADFTDPEQFALNGADHIYQINLLLGTNVTLSDMESSDFVFPDAWISASPVCRVNYNSPPTVLAYGEKDILVSYSNALRLKNKLEEYGVEHRLITFPNSGHELDNDPDKSLQYWQILELFVQNYLL
ncbi:MAG: alpha/beta hydrolase [Prevotellaceae bacterium]|jgi:acetyl esterase/lipase|nr:alpha/beta hydrolase [Prevotellaceae bacterium]